VISRYELVSSDIPLHLNSTFDVVLTGGGCRGQYAGGVLSVLMLL